MYLFHGVGGTVETVVLTGGNVQLHDRQRQFNVELHRSSSVLNNNNNSSSTRTPSAYAPRASTWCCGSFVLKQLRKTQHLE